MNLTNYFLVATESVGKSIFTNAIVYVCRHSQADGALGVVINKPSTTSVSGLLNRLLPKPLTSDSRFRSAQRVVNGGPVHPEQVLVVHSPAKADKTDDEEDGKYYDMTIRVTDQIWVTTSKDIIAAIHKDEPDAPEKFLFAFGHARWGEGQLEEEIMDNTWITIPARPDILFDTPIESRLSAATTSMGFEMSQLAYFAGNA